MPAHRSEAEEEIRVPVIRALRKMRPDARIMQEVNMDHGRNRVDVMAVSRAEIIMVEIKSERDKLDRLPVQVDAMRRCSHHTVAALHRKFMPEPDSVSLVRVEGMPWDILHWWHPSAQDMAEAHHPAFEWREPSLEDSLQVALPNYALSLLWRDELARLCADVGIPVPRRANMRLMERALRWGASGRDITLGICCELRRRSECAEADPPLEDAA